MASFTVPCPKSSSPVCFGSSAANNANQKQQNVPKFLNFSSASSLSRQPSVGFRFQYSKRKQVGGWKIQACLNEVNSASSESAPNNGYVNKSVADEASISAFIAQVSDLIKLVDMKDIVELNLKQLDCEVIIRKKEALEPPPQQTPLMMAMPPAQPLAMAPPSAPAPAASAPLALPPPTALKKPTGSSHTLKCPMAGTLYRSPAPGEPPFVKVGDRVQKGQVICIIEAMKLMNEIEADRSGTITEILVEDGKPVSIDLPLFSIAP